MGNRLSRLLLGAVIVASVVFTPVFGLLGPFRGGQPGSDTKEYFLPAEYAFFIWGVNYLGLLVLGIWLALPAQAKNPRARAAAPWLALTALCNPVWIVLAGAGPWMPWTVPVLLIMEVAAWVAYLRLGIPERSELPPLERLLNVPLRIYVGWLSVATVANSAAALNALSWDGFGVSPVAWTVILLAAASGVAWLAGRAVADDNVYRAVFVWAFVGIAVEQAAFPAVAGAAGAAAALVALMIIVTGAHRPGRQIVSGNAG